MSGSGGGASAAGCGDHIARRKRHAVGLSSRDTKFRDTGHAAAAPLACGRTGQGAAGTAPSGRRKSLFNAPRRGTREHTGDNVALAFGGSRPHVNGVPSFGALLPRLGPHVAAHFFVLLVGPCSSSPAARPACAPAQVSGHFVQAMAHAPAAMQYAIGRQQAADFGFGAAAPCRTAMRSRVLFLIAAVLLGETQVAGAQSSNSYPWCASYTAHRAAATACHFTSHHQCMATMHGIRGHCHRNARYHSAHLRQPHAT